MFFKNQGVLIANSRAALGAQGRLATLILIDLTQLSVLFYTARSPPIASILVRHMQTAAQ